MFLASLAACDDEKEPLEPVFPANYAETYREVRNCRKSGDHDLNFIRVLASPEAYDPYMLRDQPFPVGAILLKEEFVDELCTDLTRFTVMQKQEAGFAPTVGDWRWQDVTIDRVPSETENWRCTGCHADCNAYDWTCADP